MAHADNARVVGGPEGSSEEVRPNGYGNNNCEIALRRAANNDDQTKGSASDTAPIGTGKRNTFPLDHEPSCHTNGEERPLTDPEGGNRNWKRKGIYEEKRFTWENEMLKKPEHLSDRPLHELDSKSKTCLISAIELKKFGHVEYLLKVGHVDVNVQGMMKCDEHSIWGYPVNCAAKLGDEGIVILRMLHEAGANVNSADAEGNTPLHGAADFHSRYRRMQNCNNQDIKNSGARKCILLLLDYKSLITKQDHSSKRNCLISIIETKDVELVKAVIERLSFDDLQVALEAKAWNDNTCLHVAAGLQNVREEDHLQLLWLLVWKGADLDARNKDNLTPSELAPPGLMARVVAKLAAAS